MLRSFLIGAFLGAIVSVRIAEGAMPMALACWMVIGAFVAGSAAIVLTAIYFVVRGEETASTTTSSGLRDDDDDDDLEDDAIRIDWIDDDPSRLEDVRGRVNNEGGTVREAIDWLMKDE